MATKTRKCTRCQDTNGNPTGQVRGGECFLCHGTGTYAREVVTAEQKTAAQRHTAAMSILRQHPGYDWRATNARNHLEASAPERHTKLIDCVLAGRVEAVIAGLATYAKEQDL